MASVLNFTKKIIIICTSAVKLYYSKNKEVA